MNFIFISPNFPNNYWNFCDRLKKNGVNVLGIGDAPFESLTEELKGALTEYYRVDAIEDYDQMVRAVGFFTFKYGKIDWIESNNEYWLSQDARLRVDFNIKTGPQKESEIEHLKKKSSMKKIFENAAIPTARFHMVSNIAAAKKFVKEVGYPVVVTPDAHAGAVDTWKLNNDDELEKFYTSAPAGNFIMEEFIDGEIYSYDAIIDGEGNVLFESSTRFPSILDTVMGKNELYYFVYPEVSEELSEVGKRTMDAFGIRGRFVHMEFVHMEKAKKGVGKKGDFIATIASACPAGGPSTDMMNYAHSADVYQIWANMICGNKDKKTKKGKPMYSVYAFRRGNRQYAHTNRRILGKYEANIVEHREVPPLDWEHMGEYMYIANFDSLPKAQAFTRYITERR
ncbi:MAG: carbamoylphosphate synthase large subunit [Lachnospiraceae bacterium]|nr:carbamoylphosphate synthase large subunit [Lachnospiraceae bacterium]